MPVVPPGGGLDGEQRLQGTITATGRDFGRRGGPGLGDDGGTTGTGTTRTT